jgi:hypothetical protein
VAKLAVVGPDREGIAEALSMCTEHADLIGLVSELCRLTQKTANLAKGLEGQAHWGNVTRMPKTLEKIEQHLADVRRYLDSITERVRKSTTGMEQ